MIEHIDTIKQMHSTTWHWRQKPELAAVWPTPSPKNSLLFAMTESNGELIEAVYLRNGEFARNHEKNPDMLEELGDTGMMLCTAIGPDFPKIAGADLGPFEPTIDFLCFRVAQANWLTNDDEPLMGDQVGVAIFQALAIVCHLFAEHDADPVAYVEAKLQRTYDKFVTA